MEAPYSTEEERMRLLDLYRYMHGRIHSSSRPLKLIYHVAERETLLAWVCHSHKDLHVEVLLWEAPRSSLYWRLI